MLDAVVIAGGIPEPDDPLYPYTQGTPKALIDICGKPMVQWVIDALCEAESIGNVVLIGLEEEGKVSGQKVKALLPSQDGMIENIRAGINRVLEINPAARHVLIASSDIPALTSAMVDWIVETTMQTDDDVYYHVISRQVMEKRYPNSKRSYARLKDVEVCGGDINVIRASMVNSNTHLWEQLIESRKNVLKQALLIGFDTLLLLMLRMITLDDAVKKVARRLNLSGRAILCPFAEAGMDVDKPHQLEIIRADMAQRTTA